MRFKKIGTDENGRIHGEFRATGLRPRFVEEFAEVGIIIPTSIFEPGRPLQTGGGRS